MKDLICPYCGDTIEVELVYTTGYSEHRELDGFSCNNWRCNATWDFKGKAVDAPHDPSA